MRSRNRKSLAYLDPRTPKNCRPVLFKTPFDLIIEHPRPQSSMFSLSDEPMCLRRNERGGTVIRGSDLRIIAFTDVLPLVFRSK